MIGEPEPIQRQAAEELMRRHAITRRLSRAERILRRKKPDLQWVLRHHEDEPVEDAEVKERDNLDELLTGLSSLYILGAAPFAFPHGSTLSWRISRLLENEDVSRYFEKHYPIAVPVLLRAWLGDELPLEFQKQLELERQYGDWEPFVLRFLEIDGLFALESPFTDFLGLVDEIKVRGYWLNDLRHALKDRDELEEMLDDRNGRVLLEGFQDFFEVSEALDDLLRESSHMPIHQGLFWLHFGYWYGGGGKRMRRLARWLTEALDDLRSVDRTAEPEAFEGLMARLTDPMLAAGFAIEAAEGTLDRWKRHALPRGSRSLG